MRTFHVLEFLFLSFAPGRDGPIRQFGLSELHGISFFKCFSSLVHFLFGSHAKIFGTGLTLKCCGQVNLAGICFHEVLDVSSAGFWFLVWHWILWTSQPCRNFVVMKFRWICFRFLVVLDVGICGRASAGIWDLYSGVFRGDGVSWVRVWFEFVDDF